MILIPIWTFFLLGAYHSPSSSSEPGSILSGISTYTALLGAIYVINQITDRETDRRNDKLFLISRGIITVKGAWIEAAILAASSLIAAFLFLPSVFMVITAASLFLGLAYSLEPVRLKRRPFLDVAANAVGIGILNTMAGWAAAGGNFEGLHVLLPYPFAVASVHVITAIADIEGDSEQGLRTTGVVLGRRSGVIVSVVLMLIGAAISMLVRNRLALYACLLSLPFFLVAVYPGKEGNKESSILFPAKTATLAFSIMAGIAFRIYLPILALVILLTRLYYRKRFRIEYPALK